MSIWKLIKSHPHFVALGGAFVVAGGVSAMLDLVDKFQATLPALALTPQALQALPKTVGAVINDPFAVTAFVALGLAAIFIIFLTADIFWNLGRARDNVRLTEELSAAKKAVEGGISAAAAARSRSEAAEQKLIASERQNARLSTTVRETTAASNAIINRLYGPSQRPTFDFQSVHETYVFSEGGTAQYTANIALKGGASPAHFWTVWREADAGAARAELLEDIKLRVESLNPGTDVAILPTESKPHRQAFVIFFLPEIQPGEVRNISMAYGWEGYASDLVENGSTRLFWSFIGRLPTAVTDFSLTLKFGPSFRRVECRSSGAWNQTTSSLKANVSADTWVFKDSKLRLAANEYSLEIRWLDWPGKA